MAASRKFRSTYPSHCRAPSHCLGKSLPFSNSSSSQSLTSGFNPAVAMLISQFVPLHLLCRHVAPMMAESSRAMSTRVPRARERPVWRLSVELFGDSLHTEDLDTVGSPSQDVLQSRYGRKPFSPLRWRSFTLLDPSVKGIEFLPMLSQIPRDLLISLDGCPPFLSGYFSLDRALRSPR